VIDCRNCSSDTVVGDLLTKSALALSLLAGLCVCLADVFSIADLPYSEVRGYLEFLGVAVAGVLLYGIIFWFCFFCCKSSDVAARIFRSPARRSAFVSDVLVSAHGCRAPPR
tara:strand:+ start:2260 stop:2595 length:336 start_codon:yes stop_codon:yes gene_type:complete